MKTEPTAKDTTQKTIRRVAINGMVDNLGNFKFLDFLKEQTFFIVFLFAFFSTFFISYQTENYFSDPLKLFLDTTQFIENLMIYIYTMFFAYSFDTFKHFLEITHIQVIDEYKQYLINFINLITIEKPEYRLKNSVYFLLFFIFIFFIFLNILNIIQAKRQNQIRNYKITNYYTPKIFLVFEIFGYLDTKNNFYLKKLKLLQKEATFSTELKQLIMRDYFKIDQENIKEYNLIEEIKTFFYFYSIHKLRLIKEEKKEKQEKTEEGTTTQKKRTYNKKQG